MQQINIFVNFFLKINLLFCIEKCTPNFTLKSTICLIKCYIVIDAPNFLLLLSLCGDSVCKCSNLVTKLTSKQVV